MTDPGHLTIIILIIIIGICVLIILYLLVRKLCSKRGYSLWTSPTKKMLKGSLRHPELKKTESVGPRFVIPQHKLATVPYRIQTPTIHYSLEFDALQEKSYLRTDSIPEESDYSGAEDSPRRKISDYRRDAQKGRSKTDNVLLSPRTSEKSRTRSLPGVSTMKQKIRKFSHSDTDTLTVISTFPATPIVPYPLNLGQADLKLTFDARTKCVHVQMISFSNLFIKADIFLGVIPVFCEWDKAPPDEETYYLVRKLDKELAFNDISAVFVTADVCMFPRGRDRRAKSTPAIKGLPARHLLVNHEVTFRHVDDIKLRDSAICINLACHYGNEVSERVAIGQVVIETNHIVPNHTESYSMDVCSPRSERDLLDTYRFSKDLGEVILCMNHNPLAGTLVVRLVKITNLPYVGNYIPNVQVRLATFICGTRIEKFSTSSISKTNNPEFNQTFTFSLAREKLLQAALLIDVRHCGLVSKTTIGYVCFSNRCRGAAKSQWEKLTSLRHSNFFEEVSYKITLDHPSLR